jgi:hypothetical protein
MSDLTTLFFSFLGALSALLLVSAIRGYRMAKDDLKNGRLD